ncbi:MAG TPA: ChrR family anti-sigma-E factor [Hyphomicrobiaceae bacterium]
MTITHHLDDATLMSFAAGSLPSALSALAAAHVAGCPRCRRELRMLERMGGALVSALSPVSLDRSQPAMPEIISLPAPAPVPASELPAPLSQLIGGSLDDVRWRWIGPGLWHRPLKIGGEGSLQLIKAAPGASVPEHTHGGSEITLVLRGALIDSTGRYGPGDVADVDEDIEHTPVADAEAGCICAIANEQPTRFRGLLARLMQPWHGL